MAVGQSFFESSFHFKHFSVNFSLSPAHSSRGDISHHKMLFSFSLWIFHTYASLSAYGGKTKFFLDSFLGYRATFREEMTACLLRYLSSYLPCLTLGSCFCHRTLGCWGFADSELSQIHVTKHRPYPAQKKKRSYQLHSDSLSSFRWGYGHPFTGGNSCGGQDFSKPIRSQCG